MTTNNDYKSQLRDFLLYQINNNLSDKQIYKCLASFDVDQKIIGTDITSIKENACAYAEQYLTNNLSKNNYLIADQNRHFRHVNATFDVSKNRGEREVLKLYIPIKYEIMNYAIPEIHKFMIDNRINFQSKVSGTIRNELFVVRVDTKEDAEKIINFCNKKQYNKYYNKTNPFLAHVDGIGIGKDSGYTSYNQFLSKIIFLYSKDVSAGRKVNPETIIEDFQRYCKENIYGKLNVSLDKYMAKVICENLDAIINDKNILDKQVKFEYKFDLKEFSKYRRYSDSKNKYYYKDQNGNIINEETDYNLYVKLQAMNCLSKIYCEQKKTSSLKDFIVNEKVCNQISSNLDDIIDMDAEKNINCNYHDPKIKELLPYLYAEFANEYKEINKKESKNIIQSVKKNIVVNDKKLNDNAHIEQTYLDTKKVYTYKGMKFNSSIKPILINNNVFALEYLGGYSYNVIIIYNDEMKCLNNVTISLDKQKMDNDQTYAREVAVSFIQSVYKNENDNNAKYTA